MYSKDTILSHHITDKMEEQDIKMEILENSKSVSQVNFRNYRETNVVCICLYLGLHL